MRRDRSSDGQRGFTLIDVLIAIAIIGVLTSIALPSFKAQLHKTRRADVMVSLMQVQMAQERWRSNSDTYGTLAQIGQGAASSNGHYTLAVSSTSASGYVILATAHDSGAQAGDTHCLRMRATVANGNVSYASGADDQLDNDSAANRACWGQ